MTNNNFNEFTYINGYGIDYKNFANNEREKIKFFSSACGLTIILCFLMKLMAPDFIRNSMHYLLSLFFDIKISATIFTIINGVTDILLLFFSFIIPFFFYSKMVRIPLKVALPFKAFNPQKVLSLLLISVGIASILNIAITFSSIIFDFFGIHFNDVNNNFANLTTLEMIFAILKIAIIVPFVEEIIFRGVVLQSLRRFGDGFALIASSMVFALMHTTAPQIPFAFIMGIVMGYSVMITGSLWTGIIIHFFNNLSATIFSIIMPKINNDYALIIYFSYYLFAIILAVIGILLVSKKNNMNFELIPATTIYKNTAKLNFYFINPGMLITITMLILITLQSVNFG